jgi:hypothetical protein
MDRPAEILDGQHSGGIEDRTDHVGHLGLDPLRPAMEPEDVILLGGRGIVDHDLEQEPVELGLRETVGALALERVLRGQHKERRRQAAGARVSLKGPSGGFLSVQERGRRRGLEVIVGATSRQAASCSRAKD